jgi:hypothetical protein
MKQTNEIYLIKRSINNESGEWLEQNKPLIHSSPLEINTIRKSKRIV